MRASEFITETKYGSAEDHHASSKLMDKTAVSAIKGAISMPDISLNKQGGSPYAQWRFGIAMAGAPDYATSPAGATAGDPLLATYTDVDLQIINSAAKMVGAGEIVKLTDNRSTEAEGVNKSSPIRAFQGYKKK
jgi:hypothetical protein